MILYTRCCNVAFQHHPHSGRFDPLTERNQAVRRRCGRVLDAAEMTTEPHEPGAMDGAAVAAATKDTRAAAYDRDAPLAKDFERRRVFDPVNKPA